MTKNSPNRILKIFLATIIVLGGFALFYFTQENKELIPMENIVLPQSLFVDKETEIKFEWTDDNTGEDLIIQSDKATYFGVNESVVYFTITNINTKDQEINVRYLFEDKQASLKNIERINTDQSVSDLISLNKPTVRFKNMRGFTSSTNYYLDNIKSGETNYYQATINYPPNSKAEFFVEAKGNNGAYGLLDPFYDSSGLVGYWSFNGEDTNWGTNTTNDLSGQGNHGIMTNMSTTSSPVVGKIGQALDFDGVDDYVSITNDVSLAFGSGDFTISTWVKFDTTGTVTNIYSDWEASGGTNRSIVFYKNDADNTIKLLALNSSGTSFISVSSTGQVIINEWYNLIATRNSTGAYIYINGIQDGSDTSASGTISDSLTPVLLGAQWESGATSVAAELNGSIDEVLIYNKALTQPEITQLYNIGKRKTLIKTTNVSDLVSYWKMDNDITDSEGTNDGFDFFATWTKTNNVVEAASDTTGTNGRIPKGSTSGTGDDVYTYIPSVIKDGVTYKMWYSGYDGATYRIYHATSSDGLTWTKVDNTIPDASDTTSTNGRIPLGTNGTGDDNQARGGAVIKDGETYKMWYIGYDGANYRIYYATSPDGLTWTKYDNTVPSASNTTGTNGRVPLGLAGSGDDANIYGPTVIKDGETYKMWYTGHDGSTTRFYYATSPDGLTWTKYNNTAPANTDTFSTDGRLGKGSAGKGDVGIESPSVIKDGNLYIMIYAGVGGTPTAPRLYLATSPDGLTWHKYDNTVPSASNTTGTNGRVPLGLAGSGDDGYSDTPCIIKDGTNFKVWYSGYDGSANLNIYNATSPESTMTYGVAKYGTASMSFNGTSEKVNLPPAILNGAGDFTIELWAKVDNWLKAFVFMDLTHTTHQLEFGTYDLTSGAIKVILPNDAAYTFTTNMNSLSTPNDWHQYALTRSGSTLYLYRDGILVESIAGNSTAIGYTSGAASWLGVDYGANYFYDGLMDEVRVYSKSLSQSEITQLYNMRTKKFQINTSNVDRLKSGLVANWTFDGPDMDWSASSAEVLDRGGSNNGDVIGATPVSGIVGQALEFDGTGDYIDIPHSASINVGDEEKLTVSLWVKLDTLGNYYGIINKGDANTTTFRTRVEDTNKIYLEMFYSAAHYRIYTTSGTLDTNWHHLTTVWHYDSWATPEIYIDGVKDTGGVSVSPGTDQNIQEANSVKIGSASNGTSNFLDGLIDEVRIYNRALSQPEITELYNMGARKFKIR